MLRPMEPQEARTMAEEALKTIESIGYPVYAPFDELLSDAFNALEDAIATIKPVLVED
jgi:hypothetical protein